ncbi:MAG: hypothetical protein IPL01_10695 [Acidobacteria bacterium]|nr:hypothetical protein [Acidobacteriota bacterium]
MKIDRSRKSTLILPALMFLTGCFFSVHAQAQTIPTPESVLGFKPGQERRLASWDQFLGYFRKLDEASDRVKLDLLGQTTLKRPFVALTISSADNLARLEEYKDIQRKLADPRLLEKSDDAAISKLIAAGKTIVVITCSIHSTEVGGTFAAVELAHRLASSESPEVKLILDNVIVLLVPSLNPDGTDIVAQWYAKTVGTPSEGTSPPELYHYYTGHDNNRDWYAFTQVETQLTVDKLLNAWHPQILHDIHQQGGGGARFFVPPYIDPWEPNIDPAIIAGVSALGSSIAWEMTGQGKSGIVINGIYDSWTPARAFAHYHAGFRILSETASARLATPVDVPFESLGGGLNYNPKLSSWNFPKPWPGGKWTLRDIVDYQSAGAFALLSHAARHRELYLRNFLEIGRRAVEARNMPYALLLLEPEVPKSLSDAFKRLNQGLKNVSGTEQQKHEQGESLVNAVSNEPSSSEEVRYYYRTEGIDRILQILKRGGVEVSVARTEFTADGNNYPAGTHVLLMSQPYAAFARSLLEKQVYPNLLEYPGGPPKRPYDVTAHTLPLLMNVSAVTVRNPFKAELRSEPSALIFQSRVRSNGGVRVGLYKNYQPSMDEGWTRWILDSYKFSYSSILDREIRAGNLNAAYDAIIIPDQSVGALVNGLAAVGAAQSTIDQETSTGYPAEFAGGLGESGVKALRDFVEAGGTLITLNNASNFAIEKLGVPVRNVLKGVSSSDFYCPGSILRIELDASSPLSFGMDQEAIAWFEGSPAFEIVDPAKVKVIARYPGRDNPLLSGWISGDRMIRGKAAMVEAAIGKGRVIMFGFRPQYRGQSLATYPLLFNSILTAAGQ